MTYLRNSVNLINLVQGVRSATTFEPIHELTIYHLLPLSRTFSLLAVGLYERLDPSSVAKVNGRAPWRQPNRESIAAIPRLGIERQFAHRE